MTKEEIETRLGLVRGLMDIYEKWCLSGDYTCLYYIHLAADSLLNAVKEDIKEWPGRNDIDLKVLIAKENYRLKLGYDVAKERHAFERLFGGIVAASYRVDVELQLDNYRGIEAASLMAGEALKLCEKCECADDEKHCGYLLQNILERLYRLKDETEENNIPFKGIKYIEQECERRIALCTSAIADLGAYLAAHPKPNFAEGGVAAPRYVDISPITIVGMLLSESFEED